MPSTTERATDSMTHEPNYAVNLELAELINNKKANTSVSLVHLDSVAVSL